MRAADPLAEYLPRYVSVRAAVALGSLAVAALVLWSGLTRVEIVVTAPASARPVGGVAELRAPDSRGVATVMVEEGQRVAAGELILTLESEASDAQWRSATRALEAARRELADTRGVIHALDSGDEAEAAPPSRVRLQVQEHRSRLAQLDAEVRALQAELAGAEAGVTASQRLLEVERRRRRAARIAREHGALSELDWLRAGQALLAQHADLDSAVGRAGAVRQRLLAGRQARLGADAGYRESLIEAAARLDVEVAELESRVAEVDERRRQSRITAPAGGVVDQLLASEGDFVQRGELLGVVVPDRADVVFETRILPRQAAFLRAGQPCRIKLDALPFARYGALRCTVSLIGRDVVDADGSLRYYLAKVRPVTQNLEAAGHALRLQAGATGRVDIVAGRRSVLSFVTDPLQRFAQESLRER